ncbi:hypothetical protein FQN55_000909 [Onygenales sp. PD_40]|nr:hypothetical protein FQN55_000909 [Onygenales sp. PD_40]KAK2782004.1 hypothetical protein FQN53_000254 [Emmonsiellopsis sp. PD_33]KAK2803741.1 hypothetical protein FQN51_002970 [Onygenales sp. PD_10]
MQQALLAQYFPSTRIPPLNEATVLARQTAARLIIDQDQRTFPFYDLPNELQLRILECTDLVTGWPIKWHPDRGFRAHTPQNAPHTSDASIDNRPRYNRWRFPWQLFFVDRKTRIEASRIFFSKNHFIIIPDKYDWDPRPFLTSFPKPGLKLLRSIQFVVEFDYCEFSQVLRSWKAGMHHLFRVTDISKLSLTVDGSRGRRLLKNICFDQRETDSVQSSVVENAMLMVEPIAQLAKGQLAKESPKKLRDFFVHLQLAKEQLPKESPKKPRDFFVHLPLPVIDGSHQSRDEAEWILERTVMGDGYQSAKRGKIGHPLRWYLPYEGDEED